MFECTQCGACCRRVYLILDFPEKIKKDGSCVHLKDNKCEIYNKRPLICNVDALYYHTKGKTKKDFFIENYKRCNEFIKEDNLDNKYLILWQYH